MAFVYDIPMTLSSIIVGKSFGMNEHSATYLATRLTDTKCMVIKFLDSSILQMSVFIEQCELLKTHEHDSLAKTYGVFSITSGCIIPEGLPFCPRTVVATEYCNGGTMADWIKKYYEGHTICKLRIFKRVVEGVLHLHQLGMVHGNFKTSNLLFGGGCPKLCDRVMVRIDGSQSVDLSPYSAPEVRLGQGRVFASSSDSFSLGVLLVQMFTTPDSFTVWMRYTLTGPRPNLLPIFIPETVDYPSYAQLPPSLGEVDDLKDIMKGLLCRSKESRIMAQTLLSFLERKGV